MTGPTEQEKSWEEKVKTQVYEVNNGWYLEIVVPHPDNPEMPEQLMTIKCDNEWWAKFLELSVSCYKSSHIALGHLPDFKYEG